MRRLFRNKYFLMSLRLSAAAILLWWVMRDLKFSELSGLSRNGFLFSFGGALACVCFQIFLTSLRWRLLLAGQGISLTVFRAVSLTFQGQMFSLFMPGGAVGGDVLKAAFLTRETQNGRKLEGVTTIFLDRVIGMMALFLLSLTFGVCCFQRILTFTPEIRLLTFFLLAVCLAGFAAGLILLFQDVVFRIRFLAFLLRKADGILHEKLTRILNSVEVCRRDRKRLIYAFLMSFLVLHPLLVFAAVLIICGISGAFPALGPAGLAAALGNTASTAPVTPGGLGTRDKVIEVVLQGFGIENSIASLTPLIYSMVMICGGLIGVFFFLYDSFRSGSRQQN